MYQTCPIHFIIFSPSLSYSCTKVIHTFLNYTVTRSSPVTLTLFGVPRWQRDKNTKCMEIPSYKIIRNCRSSSRFLKFYDIRIEPWKFVIALYKVGYVKKALLLLVSFHLLKGRASNSHVSAQTNAQKLWEWKPAGPTISASTRTSTRNTRHTARRAAQYRNTLSGILRVIETNSKLFKKLCA